MANNKYSESIEDKAFKALDEALQIDFSQQKAPSRGAKTPDAPEAKVSDTPSARSNQQDQEESQRRRGRGSRAEQVARAPALAAANDANRMTAASILKSLDGGSTRSAVRNATLFSLLWIVGGVGLMALLYCAADLADPFASPISPPSPASLPASSVSSCRCFCSMPSQS